MDFLQVTTMKIQKTAISVVHWYAHRKHNWSLDSRYHTEYYGIESIYEIEEILFYTSGHNITGSISDSI